MINIFDDKLVITNLGGLIKPLTKEKLGEIVIRRNPLIADLLSKTNYMEKVGTGIKRIKANCEKNKNKVEFKLAKNDFFVILKGGGENFGETVGKSSVKSSVMILNIIKENPEISIPEIAKKIDLTTRAIEKNIFKLKQKSLLKRIGPAKGGYWEVR